MATLTNATDGTELEPCALVIVLRSSGLSLCSYDEQSALDLQCTHLLLLEELARQAGGATDDRLREVAAATGVDTQRLHGFVSELRARRLLPRNPNSAPETESIAADESVDMTAPRDDERLHALTPLVFRLTDRGFDLLDHDGRLALRLDALQLAAASEFRTAATMTVAHERHRTSAGLLALDRVEFDDLVTRLGAAGILVGGDADVAEGRENRDVRRHLRLLASPRSRRRSGL